MSAAACKVQMPQLEVLNRMLELPMIEMAVVKSAETYTRVKDSHQLLYWALSTAESSLTTATRQAAPYAWKLETPISFFDHTLCRGLDTIERKVPIVKEKPEQILENAYMKALETVVLPATARITFANEFIRSHAAMIKNTSWNKINEILSTQYGTAVVHGVDNTAVVVDQLLDKYFPPICEEKFHESVPAEKDKLLHTLQTVGHLSNKAARRVYSHVVHQLRTLNRANLRVYLANLVEFLQLAHYVALPITSNSKSNDSSVTANGKQHTANQSAPSDPAAASSSSAVEQEPPAEKKDN